MATQDPSARLDYAFDWSALLTDGDSVASATVVCAVGTVVVDDVVPASPKVSFWLSGGVDGERAKIVCHVVTVQGREDERTLNVLISNK